MSKTLHHRWFHSSSFFFFEARTEEAEDGPPAISSGCNFLDDVWPRSQANQAPNNVPGSTHPCSGGPGNQGAKTQKPSFSPGTKGQGSPRGLPESRVWTVNAVRRGWSSLLAVWSSLFWLAASTQLLLEGAMKSLHEGGEVIKSSWLAVLCIKIQYEGMPPARGLDCGWSTQHIRISIVPRAGSRMVRLLR